MSIIDLESGPLPEPELRKLLPPFDPAIDFPHPGEFDESAVKLGTAKKADTVAKKIDEAREAHYSKVDNYPFLVEQARENHWSKFIEKAALDPVKSRMLAFGIKRPPSKGGSLILEIEPDGEKTILETAFAVMEDERNRGERLIGVNIFGFDLPYMVKRAWMLEVDIPDWLRKGRYWADCFVDLMEVWFIGQRGGGYIGVEELCRIFKIPGKPPGITGADFDRLYWGGEESRKQAIDYLLNDLDIEEAIGNRMQVF